MSEKILIEIIEGAGGLSICINDYRIAGGKPYGVGRVAKIFPREREMLKRDLEEIIKTLER